MNWFENTLLAGFADLAIVTIFILAIVTFLMIYYFGGKRIRNK